MGGKRDEDARAVIDLRMSRVAGRPHLRWGMGFRVKNDFAVFKRDFVVFGQKYFL